MAHRESDRGDRGVGSVRRPAPWVVGVVVGVCLVGAPSAVAFQGPWVPAVNLSALDLNISQVLPRMAVAPDGTTTAIWGRNTGPPSDPNFVVQASTRPPGGRFGAPVNLAAPGQSALYPQVAVAPDGTTTAVWVGFGGGAGNVVQASTRPPGGTFGPPIDLSSSGQNAIYPQVAAAADGTTTAVWTRSDGTTTAIWWRTDGAGTVVQASTRPPGGGFGAPITLSATGQNAGDPQVAVAADGTTTAIWWRSDLLYFTNSVVQARTRRPGGTFGPPVALSVAAAFASVPQVAAAADGTTTAAWNRFNNPGLFPQLIVQASTRPPGGAFGAPVTLSPAGQYAVAPQVAVAADGTTTALWIGFNGTNRVVQARTRVPDGAFGAPVTVSAGREFAADPRLALAPDGAATALWRRYNNTNFLLQAAYTANPPTPRSASSITGSPRVGRTLRCGPGAFTGAALLTTTWLRGATPIATGSSHRITIADRGAALACRARAGNSYGSTDSLSRRLRIPPGPPIPPGSPRKAPVARSLPTVTGTPRVGLTLRCRPGAFTGAASTATSWLRGTGTIPGARRTTYMLTLADAGRTIACRTTANGPGGTSTTISLRTLARR